MKAIRHASIPRRRSLLRGASWLLLAFCWLWTERCAHAASSDIDVRLHCAWGGGESRQWEGRISISSGTLANLQLLGVESDQPGSIQLRGQQLLIRQRSPRNYDGLEVSVQGPPDAILRLEMLPRGELQPQVFTATLSELVTGYRSEALDDRSNRLVLRRAPGDLVRVDLVSSRLVFAGGDVLTGAVRGYRLGVAPDTQLRTTVQLVPLDGRKAVWQQDYRHRADETGSWPQKEPLQITLPTEEGVYNLEIEISTRRRATPLVGDKPVAQRRVQLVVVNDKRDAATANTSPPSPRLVLEVDPTQANWWNRLSRLPQVPLLPGFRADGPLGNAKTSITTRHGRTWTELPGGAWQAYPLAVEEIGVSHELQIELPSELEQTFCMSIVEPNAAGKVLPVGVDSAIQRTDETAFGLAAPVPGITSHRIPFYPRTRSPLLLITNLSEQDAAVFGRFRVQRTEPTPVAPRAADGRRQAIAFYERPLFPEAYGAPESLDPDTGRSLEDWQTFLQGSLRLVRHAQEVGYTGVAVTVASEGGSLYPSRVLQPTPKHDRGLFFGNGQDPFQKDVVELLLRICDREGLTFIPTVEFATPLPALEEQLTRGDDATGVVLVDANGMAWEERFPSQHGRGVYYNVLDKRVQAAMREVITELRQRYSSHPSFGGICISLHADGYTQLPDVGWGLDSVTWNRFLAALSLDDVSPQLMDEVADLSMGREIGFQTTARTARLRTYKTGYTFSNDILRKPGGAKQVIDIMVHISNIQLDTAVAVPLDTLLQAADS